MNLFKLSLCLIVSIVSNSLFLSQINYKLNKEVKINFSKMFEVVYAQPY